MHPRDPRDIHQHHQHQFPRWTEHHAEMLGQRVSPSRDLMDERRRGLAPFPSDSTTSQRGTCDARGYARYGGYLHVHRY